MGGSTTTIKKASVVNQRQLYTLSLAIGKQVVAWGEESGIKINKITQRQLARIIRLAILHPRRIYTLTFKDKANAENMAETLSRFGFVVEDIGWNPIKRQHELHFKSNGFHLRALKRLIAAARNAEISYSRKEYEKVLPKSRVKRYWLPLYMFLSMYLSPDHSRGLRLAIENKKGNFKITSVKISKNSTIIHFHYKSITEDGYPKDNTGYATFPSPLQE